MAGHHRPDIREPALRSRTMLATLARRPRPVYAMAVDLGLGQSIMNPTQQPERTGPASVCFPMCWMWTFCRRDGISQGWKGWVMQPVRPT